MNTVILILIVVLSRAYEFNSGQFIFFLPFCFVQSNIFCFFSSFVAIRLCLSEFLKIYRLISCAILILYENEHSLFFFALLDICIHYFSRRSSIFESEKYYEIIRNLIEIFTILFFLNYTSIR